MAADNAPCRALQHSILADFVVEFKRPGAHLSAPAGFMPALEDA
jgi:hypothetical protein